MRTSRVFVVAIVFVLGAVNAAYADVIWLMKEKVTTSAEVSWLSPLGSIGTQADADQSSGPLTNSFDVRTQASINSIPRGERPQEDTELVAFVDYQRSADALTMLMRGDTESCNNAVDCWLDARFDSMYEFRADGGNTALMTNLSWNAGATWFDYVLRDRTADATVAEFHGRDRDYSAASLDLIDGHVYSLAASLFTVGVGDKETLLDLVFDNRIAMSTTPIQAAPVPEPATLFLFGAGAAGIAARRKRQAKARAG